MQTPELVPLDFKEILNHDKDNSESYMLFNSGVNNKYTKRSYDANLDQFMYFAGLKKYDKIKSMKIEKFKMLLTKYISHCKEIGLKRGSINTRIQALFMYIDQNEMSIPKKKFKRMLPVDKIQKSQKKAYSTRDIQMMLDVSPMLRSKAIIHLFAATGIRPTAIHDLDSETHLKIKHFREMPGGYMVLTVYAEINEQDYKTCIHPEAATALKDYWRWREQVNDETVTPESPAFSPMKGYPTDRDFITRRNATRIIRDAMRNAGIKRLVINGDKTDIGETYGFRKRFHTICFNSAMKKSVKESFMGHSTGLEETYNDMKDESWLNHYKICDMELMISDHSRLKERNNRLEKEKKDEGTIKQQIARAIEQDKREQDRDITRLVKSEIRKTLSNLSTEELLSELKIRNN